jgi:hypothetical protein
MTTSAITPDQDSAPNIPASSALANAVTSAVGSPTPSPAPVLRESGGLEANAPDVSGGGGSRLQSILSAVARVGSTAMAGIPESRRPGFVTGLGGGARAEQQAQAVQQDIKFKSFQDQVRMAELHAQDQKLQLDTQAQTDAHTKAELDNKAIANSLGIDYDVMASHGDTVMDHLKAQTAANGAASVPPGTHLSGDGNTINIPQNTQKTRDGQKAMYTQLAPALGLPPIPEGASFVPPQLLNIMTNKIHGFDQKGEPIKHDDLPAYISATQTQRDAMAKSGASDAQLTTLDNILGIYKANLNALDTHAAGVKQQSAQAQKAGEITAESTPEAIKAAADKASAVSDAELPNKLKVAQAQSDIKANAAKANAGDWLPKVGADEKKKAELAENIAFNANEVAKIVMKRPDILGAVAGRYTNAQQMIGNNDPDISALGVHVHNMAMANSGVHGFRSQEGVESYERQLLNNFKNGPAAMAGALQASTGSVQTFVDNARPESYKTHSKQGGAVRGMMGGQ